MMACAKTAMLIASVEAATRATTKDVVVAVDEEVGVEEAIVTTDIHEDIQSMIIP